MSTTENFTLNEWVPVSQAAMVMGKTKNGIYWLIDNNSELVAKRFGPKSMMVSRESVIEALRARGAIVEVDGDMLTITRDESPAAFQEKTPRCRVAKRRVATVEAETA